MKLYIKTDKKGIITESSLVSYKKNENVEEIEVTQEQHDAIRKDFDTKVKDWKIVQQVEWDNAIIKKEQKIESERLSQEKKTREQEKLSKSAE